MDNQEFESATVIWYNHEKRYGFARDKWGQQIFFHLNDGRHCKIEKRELKMFARSAEAYGKFHLVPEPVTEDVILFIRAKGSKGRDKASPWTFRYMETEAWLDYENDNSPCPSCPDKLGEHDGDGKCMVNGCHCGDEDYEHDEPLNTTPTWTTGPGGMEGYES